MVIRDHKKPSALPCARDELVINLERMPGTLILLVDHMITVYVISLPLIIMFQFPAIYPSSLCILDVALRHLVRNYNCYLGLAWSGLGLLSR